MRKFINFTHATLDGDAVSLVPTLEAPWFRTCSSVGAGCIWLDGRRLRIVRCSSGDGDGVGSKTCGSPVGCRPGAGRSARVGQRR